MPNIDITTTQKVTIEYELASLRDRIFGWLMDFLIITGSLIILFLLFVGAFDPEFETINLFQYFIALPIFLFYTLVSEILMDGQTLGKRAVGIKVIKLNGKAPTVTDYLVRWVFRLVDIYLSAGTIASLLISSSDKGQRLGDLTANTTLIKVKFSLRFRLEDIEKISSLDNYEPSYPQVRQLSEQDMLSIKTVIARYRKYPNYAHQQVVVDLVDNLAGILELDSVPRNKIEFLKTLIRDYIVLTR